MDAMSRREGKEPLCRCDSQNANKKSNEFYREARPRVVSDSTSSERGSDCDDSDYMTSYDEPLSRRQSPMDDQISDKLSAQKLSLCRKQSQKDDSILARSPRADESEESIASIADSKFSCILAGRLDEGGDAGDERSLLNIAINESQEKYEDSLDEVCRISRSNKIERDSLEPHRFGSKGNTENLDPNIRRIGSLPRIVSDELVKIPLKIVDKRMEMVLEEAICSDSILRDKNDNIREVSMTPTTVTDQYDSLVCEKERLIVADIKTPKPRGTHFIEDCCKSSPKVGVNADTFGSEFITDISHLSMLGGIEKDPESCRKKILRKFSQQFAVAPTVFTEKLLNLFDESFLPNSKAENGNVSGVDLSRLTEEFRKICRGYGKGIEDESMPNLSMAQSFLLSTPPAGDQVSSFQNFSKLGGGKKIYRKTPRRVAAGIGNQCGTPNCRNALHRGTALLSPGFRSGSMGNDSTATFEYWENFCYEESPTKQSKSKLAEPEKSEGFLLSHEELIRRSNEQMASLEQSVVDEASPIDRENFSITSSKECQDHSCSTRKKFIENLSSSLKNSTDKSVDENVAEFNCKQKYFEVENSLAARLLEKRRKCFEEARKVFENPGNLAEKNDKPLEKVSECKGNADPVEYDNFVNTLAACMDYVDHAQTLQIHRNSLHCILECSEGPESLRESLDESRPLHIVETVVIPMVNRSEVLNKKAEALPKTPKLVSQVSLYVPGSPICSSGSKLPSQSPRGFSSRRSAGHRLSPSRHGSSVVAKKIRSPVSPVRQQNIRSAKPASHSFVPRTPCETLPGGSHKSWAKSSPGIHSNSDKVKSAGNSPGLMVVTNIKKIGPVPKVIVTNSSPVTVFREQCQKQSHFSESGTPVERTRQKKFFFTPDKTPTYGKVRQKKKYFNTPGQTPNNKRPVPPTSPSVPGTHRINYNIVQSPVGNYIRGTDPNLITNVRGKTNERMLTPRSKTPGSARNKAISPILARSPRLSPTSSETSRLKFRLNSPRRQNQNQESDILNIALCESDRSSNVGSESTSHSPFPKIFYKPAQSVKMLENNLPRRRIPKTLGQGMEEKIIYRHEGRLKPATKQKVPSSPVDTSTKDSLSSCDSGDISLLHQRPAAKTNYLLKK